MPLPDSQMPPHQELKQRSLQESLLRSYASTNARLKAIFRFENADDESSTTCADILSFSTEVAKPANVRGRQHGTREEAKGLRRAHISVQSAEPVKSHKRSKPNHAYSNPHPTTSLNLSVFRQKPPQRSNSPGSNARQRKLRQLFQRPCQYQINI